MFLGYCINAAFKLTVFINLLIWQIEIMLASEMVYFSK